MSSSIEARVEVKPSYGLSDNEIAGMLKDSISHAADDVSLRSLREKQVDARRLIEATVSAIKEDGGLLGASEREEIDARIQKLESSLESDDVMALSAAMDALIAVTEAFAAQRMNHSVHQALTGRTIEELDS